MTDSQIKQILIGMEKLEKGYEFFTTDREIPVLKLPETLDSVYMS